MTVAAGRPISSRRNLPTYRRSVTLGLITACFLFCLRLKTRSGGKELADMREDKYYGRTWHKYAFLSLSEGEGSGVARLRGACCEERGSRGGKRAGQIEGEPDLCRQRHDGDDTVDEGFERVLQLRGGDMVDNIPGVRMSYVDRKDYDVWKQEMLAEAQREHDAQILGDDKPYTPPVQAGRDENNLDELDQREGDDVPQAIELNATLFGGFREISRHDLLNEYNRRARRRNREINNGFYWDEDSPPDKQDLSTPILLNRHLRDMKIRKEKKRFNRSLPPINLKPQDDVAAQEAKIRTIPEKSLFPPHPLPKETQSSKVGMWDMMVTYAFGGPQKEPIDGIGTNAVLRSVCDMCCDGRGNLYINDPLSKNIRKVDVQTSEVTTLAGSHLVSPSISFKKSKVKDGKGTNATFNKAYGLCCDPRDGSVILADTRNHRIRHISPDGEVTTIAGRGVKGKRDGHPLRATFNLPSGVIVEPLSGDLYVVDTGNQVLRKVVRIKGSKKFVASEVVTFAGSKKRVPEEVLKQRQKEKWRFHPTSSSFSDPDDRPKHFSSDSDLEISEPDGLGTKARFWNPSPITCDSHGNIYVGELQRYTIRKITPDAHVTTLIRQTTRGGDLFSTPYVRRNVIGSFNQQKFRNIRFNLAMDSSDNIYWNDKFECTIKKANVNGGFVQVVAGSPNERSSIDGHPLHATLNTPSAIAFDWRIGNSKSKSSGNWDGGDAGRLYIGENWSYRIRRIEKQPLFHRGFHRKERNRLPEWYRWMVHEEPYDPDRLSKDRWAVHQMLTMYDTSKNKALREKAMQLRNGIDVDLEFPMPHVLSHGDIAKRGAQYFIEHRDDEIKLAIKEGRKPPKYGYTPMFNPCNWEPGNILTRLPMYREAMDKRRQDAIVQAKRERKEALRKQILASRPQNQKRKLVRRYPASTFAPNLSLDWRQAISLKEQAIGIPQSSGITSRLSAKTLKAYTSGWSSLGRFSQDYRLRRSTVRRLDEGGILKRILSAYKRHVRKAGKSASTIRLATNAVQTYVNAINSKAVTKFASKALD
ncbi:hypothetical protein AAMO2058_001068000 [Amorphochlora amoebiformis]